MNLDTLLVLFTCLADTTVLSSEDVKLNVKWGGELVIKLDTPPPPDSSILWKINRNKVVEYDKDFPDLSITAYGPFTGRVTLDRTTGELKVTSLTNADNGVYSVEYDSKLQPNRFSVSVFSADKLNVTGELVIKADTPPPPDSSILWRINSNKVVEYDKDFPSLGIIPYGTFKDRVTLDRTTGELKVTSLTNEDDGLYSVEYDSKLQPKSFSVSVFNPDTLNIKRGGELVIKADTPPPPDSSILWRINSKKVVEYDRSFADLNITAYGTFRGRVTLDRTTGELKVTSLTKADNGVYSVEYNNKLQPKSFSVSVFNKLNVTWGGELVIKADTPPPPDSGILWRINSNKVVEYDKDFPFQRIHPYGTFRGRVTLDRTTGELKVTSLTNEDDGVYSVEYDSKLQPETFSVSVFRTIPMPTINSSCDNELTSCTLTCEGNTADAGEVAYSWKKNGETLTDSEPYLQITMEITYKEAHQYTCQLSNLVSQEESEPLINPLSSHGFTLWLVSVVLPIIVLLLGLCCICLCIYFSWKRKKLRIPVLDSTPTPTHYEPVAITDNDVVVGSGAGNSEGDNVTTNANNSNVIEVAMVPLSGAAGEGPLNTATTPDLHGNTEDRQDNGNTDTPTEPEVGLPLIDEIKVHSDLHEDVPNNTNKKGTGGETPINSDPKDTETADDAV